MIDNALAERGMFQERGYAIVQKLIPDIMCQHIAKNIQMLQKSACLEYGDDHVKNAYSGYGLPSTELLLRIVMPKISEITNCRLCPTYSYARIYLQGAELPKHVDRPSCEISATLAISYNSPRIWPIFIETNRGTVSIKLEQGDALVYSGIDIPHWREKFDGEYQIQVFLHYIREDGQYKEFIFDKRSHLDTPLFE